MKKFYDTVVNSRTGRAVSGATVSFLDDNEDPVTTYEDDALGGGASSVLTDANGLYQRYIPNGTYTIRQSYTDSAGDTVTVDVPGVEIYDEGDQEAKIARSILAPSTESGVVIPTVAQRAGKAWLWGEDGSVQLYDVAGKEAGYNPATVYAAAFGIVMDDDAEAAANTTAWTAMLDYLSTNFGGGEAVLPPGVLYHEGLEIGDGSDSDQATKHHNIKIRGAGSGSSNDVSNVDVAGVTVLKYAGSTSSSAACMRVNGPLHNLTLEGFELDCDAKAGYGLDSIHVGDLCYRKVVVRNWTERSYRFTTRPTYVTGVAYGCGNGTVYDCYAYLPATNSANGIELTSGVDTATTLVGNPDTANLDIFGGVYMYGGDTGTCGVHWYGCDNNTIRGAQIIPKGGNDNGGASHKWEQWPGSPVFPLGNKIDMGGFSQGMTGTAGTGGNLVFMDSSDSGWTPNIVGATFHLSDGKTYKNGQRAYAAYDIQTAELNNSSQTTTSTSFGDVTGLSVTVSYPAASKLKLSFAGLASKATAGSGDFILNFNGSDRGMTTTRIVSNGTSGPVAAQCLVDLPLAGSSVTAKVRFKSSDSNQVAITHASLVAEVLY